MDGELDPQGALDVRNLREFFRDSVHSALERQHVQVDDHTEYYVVSLLTTFARSEELYEATPDGPRLRPLALMFAEAVEASTPERRSRALQRLGDVSLFVAGFFARGFARKLVDIDYHIAMGGSAYGCWQVVGAAPGSAPAVFAELRRSSSDRRCAQRVAKCHLYRQGRAASLKSGSRPAARAPMDPQRLGIQPAPVAVRQGAN
jgi:hypothetical protein